MGGLARRAAFVDSLRATTGRFLLLDGGDFLPRSCERDEPKAVLVWAELHRLGYDAVSLGEHEIVNWAFCKRMMTETPLPVVSTNLEQLVAGRWVPIGERSLVVEANGVEIGIVSAIEEDLVTSTVLGANADSIRVLPPMETLRRAIDELPSSVEAVVLLAHMSSQTLEQIASLMPGLVVLGGHMTQDDRMPIEIGGAYVNRSGPKGAYLATTRLILSPDGRIEDVGGLSVKLDQSLREDPDVLARIEQATGRKAAAPPPPPPVQMPQPERTPEPVEKQAPAAKGSGSH